MTPKYSHLEVDMMWMVSLQGAYKAAESMDAYGLNQEVSMGVSPRSVKLRVSISM